MGFDPADTGHFNITVRNLPESIIDLTLTKITETTDDGTVAEITETDPTLPYLLPQDSFNTFTETWDWTNYRDRNVTITAYTQEGYTATRTQSTQKPVILSVTDITVDPSNTTYFNVTVTNSEYSTIPANLALVQLNFQDQTSLEVSTETPTLPYGLPISESVTLKCLWDCTDQQDTPIIVVVETSEGYFGQSDTYIVG
jgi:3D (Asp-Asp-Asp) domain-containing protein